jgi:hypothetical protein
MEEVLSHIYYTDGNPAVAHGSNIGFSYYFGAISFDVSE